MDWIKVASIKREILISAVQTPDVENPARPTMSQVIELIRVGSSAEIGRAQLAARSTPKACFRVRHRQKLLAADAITQSVDGAFARATPTIC